MNPFKRWRGRKPGGLLENTIMLFIMQFTTLVLGFLTTSLQSRVLGADNAGILSFALLVMSFFQLFLDFGFIQSATGKIAAKHDDKPFVSKVFTTVTVIKFLFICISAIALFILLRIMKTTGLEYITYWICLLSVATNSMMCEYLYKGLERMSAITYRTVAIKIFSVAMVFVFMKQPHQYYMVPLFTSIGNIVALAFIYWHLFTKMGVHFVRITVKDVFSEIKSSAFFFFSRIATTAYSQLNGIILGNVNGKSASFYYRSADTVLNAARTGIVSPVSDSLYPHMMRTKQFSLIKKTLKFGLPILIAGCAGVFALAPTLCTLWLKDPVSGRETALILRCLMPTVVLALPNYLLGFPTLGAMGLSKYVNQSTVFGTIFHLSLLCVMAISGGLSTVTLCILSCITETMILTYRIIAISRNRHLLKPDEAARGDEK